mmetsp:Transcript_71842/g.119563  ORF Transcript_71842/g.119563 Transcript_71842/m.119563 type:complete len:345 (-) Transcript_71842:394-1428(-)
MKIVMIILACSELSAVRADRSVDDTSIVAMLKVMQEQMQEQMAKLEDRIMAKDETIASLTAALQSKTEHRQVQLTVGGEVMQLVSEAEFKELASRVAKCEKTNADQDAKLGMTMDTLVKVRKEIKDARVGAPPALPPSPPPPLPPPQSVATPGRQLQFSSNGNSVNELSLKGPNAVTSWNSRTPGLTSFNCTGVGDGKLTCSGEMYATNFVTDQGNSVNMIAAQLAALNDSVSTVLGVGYCKVAPPTFVEHVGQVQTKVNADEWKFTRDVNMQPEYNCNEKYGQCYWTSLAAAKVNCAKWSECKGFWTHDNYRGTWWATGYSGLVPDIWGSKSNIAYVKTQPPS